MGHNREQLTGKFYGIGKKYDNKSGILVPVDPMAEEFEKNKIEQDIEKAKQMYLELEKEKQAELEKKLETLELIPMYDKVILLPYPTNPYRKVLQGNIIVDYTGAFKNPDTGEDDILEEGIQCGKIIEVGPNTKFVKVGDDVFFDKRTVYKVPFFSQGYRLTSETQLLCVLNEGLKTRFKME
jgi:hypothetical protein